MSVESAFHAILPNFPKYELEKYIKDLLQPILDANENNFQVRDFTDTEEREEVYENTYGDLVDELLDSEDIEDRHNLDLIHYIYDLLEYDKVVIIDNEKFLYSFIYINAYAQIHQEAYRQLEVSYKNKPSSKNIDTATNKSKDKKSQVDFLTSMLKPATQNSFVDSRSEKLKLGFLENYKNEYRMIARSIHEFAKIKEYSGNFEINTIGSLEPYINSDGLIPFHDMYVSWYAHVYTIYKTSEMPVTKKLKLAQLSSYIIFPQLRGNQKLIINEKTATKPIREIAMYKNLKLLEFTDNRTIIKRTDDEIKSTEEYLTKVTGFLNKYS
ncbi:MAG: hypothetical protein WA099_10385 [Sulfuricurvum sp.]